MRPLEGDTTTCETRAEAGCDKAKGNDEADVGRRAGEAQGDAAQVDEATTGAATTGVAQGDAARRAMRHWAMGND